jgi:hypothetical protein
MTGQANAATTVEAKFVFEHVAASHGVTVKHYHSDNGLSTLKCSRPPSRMQNRLSPSADLMPTIRTVKRKIESKILL